ncbi:SH3 domain-containing protein [Neolecta irregularis DAH-3]|uniref:SH3 domain-containing protein n=1 Tax=Neolecta irregularis (strain DAH-3) TaxID=1198029 RepID=A0A1U7LT82_NEOID|nr:SH3 domain-containing protein [Neolecta irregularis DAH-3]|eukprot:OLL25752.1 SH3 domain-containing protein [Neolecta irregularis DAH-3]
MGIHSPLPNTLTSECRKCARILTSFVKPSNTFGSDKVIPPSVLRNAKGLAIITVLKAGFLFTGRVGSGLVIARLANGNWSAPSAIIMGGMGIRLVSPVLIKQALADKLAEKSQIVTGFANLLIIVIFILNDQAAVKTFSQAGSITLGGNISVALGPLGRNVEAAGGASLKSVAAVFAYSKTKGLFAGISLEGSALIERKDANKNFYRAKVTANQILSGAIDPPLGADPLYAILNTRAFRADGIDRRDSFSDIPDFNYTDDNDDDWGRNSSDSRSRSNSLPWKRGNPFHSSRRATIHEINNDNHYIDDILNPFRDQVASTNQPNHFSQQSIPNKLSSQSNILRNDQAIASFTFKAERPGDLGFKKGDIIDIIKRTPSQNDWWKGRIGNQQGIFPANYVKTRE